MSGVPPRKKLKQTCISFKRSKYSKGVEIAHTSYTQSWCWFVTSRGKPVGMDRY